MSEMEIFLCMRLVTHLLRSQDQRGGRGRFNANGCAPPDVRRNPDGFYEITRRPGYRWLIAKVALGSGRNSAGGS